MDRTGEFLAAHAYFHVLDRAQVSRLSQMASLRRLAPGQILALEGDPCEFVYLIFQGSARVLKTSPEGREQVLDRLGIGEPLYLIPALDGGPLPATVQALEELELICFSRAAFLRLLDQYPAVCKQILRDLAARLRRFGALAADLSLRTVSQRLAKMLVERALSSGRHRATQREMAAELGTVREVVARSLSQFEKWGWIRLGRGLIEILDLTALREHALLEAPE